jgi:hypothetical protein
MARLSMSPELLEELCAIVPFDTAERRSLYINGRFPRANAVQDLDKRYRWDLLNDVLGYRFACKCYDTGLTDAHIDSALRSLVSPLGVGSEQQY